MMLRRLLAAAACFATAQALASGGYAGPNFANSRGTDIVLARYQAGELGVLRPSYERVFLYGAWRAIALGPQGLKAAPNLEHGLEAALGASYGGWSDVEGDEKVFEKWQAAVEKAIGRQPPQPPLPYLACPLASYRFATDTLGALAQRPDATAARLQAWVQAQRTVFRVCGDDPDTPKSYPLRKVAVAMPAELPAAEALYWRQLRQYQLAAAAFHSGQHAASAERFARIGATRDHPMRAWGAYLQLRSMARAGAAGASPEAAVQAIAALADKIQADPALEARHEDARAVLRMARAAITPQARLAELSAMLADPAADPYDEDQLGDWRYLLSSGTPANYKALRQSTGFIDWIETLRECPYPVPAACAPQRAHAEDQWRAAVQRRDAAQSRVWLAASAMLAAAMPPDLEKAALLVAPAAPEYLTVRHALVRHYRLAGQPARARSVADALLASPQLKAAHSISANNLLLQERFPLAETLADAAAFLVRTEVNRQDYDTGEGANATTPRPAEDGLHWLNAQLSVASLTALAADKRLPGALRARIGVAAWMRADLLDDAAGALKAAATVAGVAPQLAPVMARYRSLPARARRAWMLESAMRHNLSPTVGLGGYEEFKPVEQDNIVAGMWCKIPADPDTWYPEGAAPPPTPVLPGAGAEAEIAALGAMKTATGFVGEHVMARAAATPKDPALPWLLHVVVKSTRGGCLDADAKELSRKAFRLLHQRYPKSEWAAKTPYHY